MLSNPFKFGNEVSGDQFYDRQDAFEKLYRKLAGGSCNVVMYAPRRYGKTSLVKKVLARFEGEGVPTVSIDLNKIATIEKFCENYALAAEPVREFTESYRMRHSLGGSSTVHTALKALIEKGVVESESEAYFIGDPFFARYIRA